MSGNDEANLGRLSNLLNNYQKKTLNLSKKAEDDEPANQDSSNQDPNVEEGAVASDSETDEQIQLKNDEQDKAVEELEGKMDQMEDVQPLPEEATPNHSEDMNNISEFSTDFPDELPDMPNFAVMSEKMPFMKTNNQIPQQPRLNVVHKSAPRSRKNISPLTVLTYNMCMQKNDFVNRAHHLMKLILSGHKYKPDLVCLQEVTPESYRLIQQGLGIHYYLFEIFGSPPVPYSNLIAINKATMDIVDDTLGFYDLPKSDMSRKLMICHVMIKKTGTKFHVLNTQLESFEQNMDKREMQMKLIDQVIQEEGVKNFVLTGDFNICNENEPIESLIRLYDYHDAWIEMGSPQSLKYTYDPKENPYAKGNKGRLDRILYRFGNTDKAVITKLKLMGIKQPVPSDHYGLLAEFLIKNQVINT